jgi:hypothetical protein
MLGHLSRINYPSIFRSYSEANAEWVDYVLFCPHGRIGLLCFVKIFNSNFYYNMPKPHDLVYKSDKSDRNLIRVPTYICVTCLCKGGSLCFLSGTD